MDKPYPEPREIESSVGSILENNENIFEAGLFDGLVVRMENRLPENWNAQWHGFNGMLDTNPDTSIWTGLKVYPFLLTMCGYHVPPGSFSPADVFPVVDKVYPSTLKITFYNDIVDTTISRLREYQIPINFNVFDMDDGDQLSVLTVDSLDFGTAYHSANFVLLKEIFGRLYAVCRLVFFQENLLGELLS